MTCLDGLHGPLAHAYAEEAIAATPETDLGENNCRAIADHIIHAVRTNQETHR